MKFIFYLINEYLNYVRGLKDYNFSDETIIRVIIKELASFNYIGKNYYFHLKNFLTHYDKKNNTDFADKLREEIIILNYQNKIPDIKFDISQVGEYDFDIISTDFSKHFIKQIKEHFRRTYFMFQTKHHSKLDRLMEDIEGNFELILNCHSSTYERKKFYDEFYKLIAEYIDLNGVSSILDLGCGLNPLSYTHFDLTDKKLFVNEINQTKHLAKLMEYYGKRFGAQGHVLSGDLIDIDTFPEVDVCFALKLFETLEASKRGITRLILPKLKCKWLIVSFSSKSLSGKRIYANREWFETLLESKEFHKHEIFNEIIYVIKWA